MQKQLHVGSPMTNETYNGWTNYETWNVALWLDNEENSYIYWRETAQACWDHATEKSAGVVWTRDEAATFALAELLKADIEESNPVADSASMYADMMGAALSEVNWREIAEHYIDDVDKGDEDADGDEDSDGDEDAD